MTSVERQAKEDSPSERVTGLDRSVQAGEKTAQLGSDELGTGYEEDTEKGGLSSDGSADLSDKEGSASQPESLFKPVKENDPSELSLDDLRATKAKRVSSPDEVKAPSLLGRAIEEVEAVAEAALEGLTMKEKR